MVVEDNIDGEALVTFSYVWLHVIPFSSVQFIQLTNQLEKFKLSKLMEGTYILCGDNYGVSTWHQINEGAWLKMRLCSHC